MRTDQMNAIPHDTPSNHVGGNKRSALHRMFAFRTYGAMPVGYLKEVLAPFRCCARKLG